MKQILALLNLISTLAVIIWNYYTLANGVNGNDVGEVSDRYDTLFTPAGYAFSIWGIIFLSMLAFSLYQIWVVFISKKSEPFIENAGPWYTLANMFNCLWVWFWLTGKTEVTIIFMLGILISLLAVIVRTNMQRAAVSRRTKLFQWTPIALYAGWITVATIANVGAILVKNNWDGGFLGEVGWAILMIGVATSVNLVMIQQRNLLVFAGVGVWALVAIAVKQWEPNSSIAWTAVGCTVVLCLAIFSRVLKPSFRM